jgi:hypothetical protein
MMAFQILDNLSRSNIERVELAVRASKVDQFVALQGVSGSTCGGDRTYSVCNASQSRSSLIQLPDEFALVQVPKHDRSVSARADKHFPVGADAEAVDRTGMEGKVVDELQGVSVPD